MPPSRFTCTLTPRHGDLAVRYVCRHRVAAQTARTVAGRTVQGRRCAELSLWEDSVELVDAFDLQGTDLPAGPDGRTLRPATVVATQSHSAFLADPGPVRDTGAVGFPSADWPVILEEAAAILRKARDEGRWRKHLEVAISASEVDAALAAIRAGAGLEPPLAYSSARIWWDAAQGTFLRRIVTDHPYTGERREDVHPMGEAEVRAELEAIDAAVLPRRLR